MKDLITFHQHQFHKGRKEIHSKTQAISFKHNLKGRSMNKINNHHNLTVSPIEMRCYETEKKLYERFDKNFVDNISQRSSNKHQPP